MLKFILKRLLLRWVICSLGLWIAAGLINKSITYNRISDIILAGLILAIVNMVLKPLLLLLSLPAIIFSLGLFVIIINGFMVYIVSRLYSGLKITNFWAAVFAGMVIGLVNYLVSAILADRA